MEHKLLQFIFDEEIIPYEEVEGNKLEGYLWSTDSLVEYAKEKIAESGQVKLEDIDIVQGSRMNMYAIYDLDSNDITIDCNYYTDVKEHLADSLYLTLSEANKAECIKKFEEYCEEVEGLSCRSFLKHMRNVEKSCLTKEELDLIENALKDTEWTVTCYDTYISFQAYSPAGEDLYEEIEFGDVKTLDDLNNELRRRAEYFDPEEHAAMWYKATKGEPSSLRDLLADADAIKEMYEQLAEKVDSIANGIDMDEVIDISGSNKPTPFNVIIEKHYVKEVEIYATSAKEAERIADDLQMNGVIELGCEDFVDEEIYSNGKARAIDLELNDVYDRNGRINKKRLEDLINDVKLDQHENKVKTNDKGHEER